MKPKKTKLKNGLTVFYTSKEDLSSLYEEIFVEKAHEKYSITLNDGDCVIDVGANIGLFAIWIAQQCKDPKIYAFEPIPDTFEALKQNLELFSLTAKPFNLGVSEKAGSANFIHFPHMAMISTMHYDYAANMKKLLMDGMVNSPLKVMPLPLALLFLILPRAGRVSLSKYLTRYLLQHELIDCSLVSISQIIQQENISKIDLLKIDAEACEVEILKGINVHDWPKIKQLIVEVHMKDYLAEVLSILETHGFECNVDQQIIAKEDTNLYMVYAKKHL